MVREALFSDSGDGLLEEGHTYKGQISIRVKFHLIDAKEDNNNNFENINTLFFSSLPCFMKGGDGCRHDISEKKFRYHIFRVKRKNAQLLRKCKRIGFFSEKNRRQQKFSATGGLDRCCISYFWQQYDAFGKKI